MDSYIRLSSRSFRKASYCAEDSEVFSVAMTVFVGTCSTRDSLEVRVANSCNLQLAFS